ncbi:MAG: hypothetical protein GC205_13235 [Bacteroidetes bacterium]|nr:hypothetical protein [Bacteroidota bacterium]
MRWSVTVEDYVVYHARSTSTSDGGYMTVGVLGSNGSTVPLGFHTRVWKWDEMATLQWTHDWEWGSSSSSMRPDLYASLDGNVYVHSIRSGAAADYMHVARFGDAGLQWEDSFAVNMGSFHFAGRDTGFILLSHVADSLYITQ